VAAAFDVVAALEREDGSALAEKRGLDIHALAGLLVREGPDVAELVGATHDHLPSAAASEATQAGAEGLDGGGLVVGEGEAALLEAKADGRVAGGSAQDGVGKEGGGDELRRPHGLKRRATV
jgi:hypothetical protein